MDVTFTDKIVVVSARSRASLTQATAAVVFLLALAIVACAHDGMAAQPVAGGGGELVIDGDYTSDVFGFGRNVVVRGRVRHGVIAFGGDVVIEGDVEGDVGVIGGTVVQKEGSYIGGDVMVFGGKYHHGMSAPERGRTSRVIMFAGNEDELRQLARNPLSLLSPEFSLSYFGNRLLAVLFWFIVSLALTAATPGAVSRAAARLQITSLRVAFIGLLGAVVAGPGVAIALRLLPPSLGVVVFIMAVLLLVVSYLFGRVVVHAATGRWLQRVLLAEERRSETVALLLGAVFWSLVLALPYVWPVLVIGLVIVSLGLSLTARYRLNWRRA